MMSEKTERASELPEDLVKAALDLPEPARGRRASILLDSLDDEFDDPELVHEEWKNEIARRIEDIQSGKAQLVDGHATLLRLREELKAGILSETTP